MVVPFGIYTKDIYIQRDTKDIYIQRDTKHIYKYRTLETGFRDGSGLWRASLLLEINARVRVSEALNNIR